MKSVLISIQPKWCELIANGKKTVEVRKTKPKMDEPFKCYIYCTKQFYRKGDGYFQGKYCGKVIGEFVCDRVQLFESEFVDDDCYESIASLVYDEDGDATGFIEWSNDSDFSYESTDFYKKCCVKYEELKKYMGQGINEFYSWHISDLTIYDKPKELSEFYSLCEKGNCHLCDWEREYDSCGCNRKKPILRPPQSWCYVDHPTEKGGEE